MAFQARYRGTCASCGGPVLPGQYIRGVRGRYSHTRCPAELSTVREARLSGPAPYAVLEERAASRQDYIADERSSYGGWQTRRSANAEYRRGIAEGQEYSRNRKVFGDALAEQWEMEAEMARYNRGEDY
jgi:hypothetical protein